jgi:hypothetical protein
MDVSNQFQKIRIFLAEDGLVPILEKLPMAPVTTVKGDGITGEKSPHNSGDWMISGSKQKMHVIGE